MCDNCKALSDAIDRYIAKADGNLEELLESEGYYDAPTTVKYINAIEEGVAEVLTAETQYFVTQAEKAVDLRAFAGNYWEAAKANDSIAAKLYKIFVGQFKSFMPHFIDGYIQLTDAQLRLTRVSQRTLDWVDSWSGELSKIMRLNSHAEIESILKKGLEEGTGIAGFVQNIQESGIREEYYKARRVAVTEVLRAHSVAHNEAIQQSPTIDTKTWRHSGGTKIKPRANHVEMDMQTVPKTQSFAMWSDVNGEWYYPMFPRDPNLPPEESINCHCILQGNASEKALGMSIEERRELQQKIIDEMDDDWERELNEKNKAKAGIDV